MALNVVVNAVLEVGSCGSLVVVVALSVIEVAALKVDSRGGSVNMPGYVYLHSAHKDSIGTLSGHDGFPFPSSSLSRASPRQLYFKWLP